MEHEWYNGKNFLIWFDEKNKIIQLLSNTYPDDKRVKNYLSKEFQKQIIIITSKR